MSSIEPVLDLELRLAEGRMSPLQMRAVGLCVLLDAFDGYDVLAAGFAAPSLARAWHLAPATLGLVLSAGPLGMAIGALLVAPLGDVMGRRRTVLLTLAMLALGMLASAAAPGMGPLTVARVFTGIGIGGMLPMINVISAEFASRRRRALAINLMGTGYPLGATICGVSAAALVGAFGWRGIFAAGGLAALGTWPLIAASLPESPRFLLARTDRPGALRDINRLRRGLGLAALAVPPPLRLRQRRGAPLRLLLQGAAGCELLLLSVAFFFAMITVYVGFSWTPRILAGMGFRGGAGLATASVLNAAGIAGTLLFGLLGDRVALRHLSVVSLLGFFASVAAFGRVGGAGTPAIVAVLAAVGFFLAASVAALHTAVPAVFAAATRATGAGITLAVGRAGATVGPALTGWLMQARFGLPTVCVLVALPCLAAAACLWASPALRAAGGNEGGPAA